MNKRISSTMNIKLKETYLYNCYIILVIIIM